jgi:hypothetical protein
MLVAILHLSFFLSLSLSPVPGTVPDTCKRGTHCFPFAWLQNEIQRDGELTDLPGQCFPGEMSRPCCPPPKFWATTNVCRHSRKREAVNCKLLFSVAERSPLSIMTYIWGEGRPVYMEIYSRTSNLFAVIRPGPVIDESIIRVFSAEDTT